MIAFPRWRPEHGRSLALCAMFSLLLAPNARAAKPGDLAPPFRLASVRDTVASDSLRGSVVWLDFWASWCGPCARSFPWMAQMHERYAAQGLRVVAVNLDKEALKRDEFLESHRAPFTVAYDPKGHTAEAYHVSAMPTSVLIGRDGKVLLVHAGFDPKSAADLEKRIQEALR